MIKVFLCSPYGGEYQNRFNAERAARFIMETEGVAVMVPHVMFTTFLDDSNTEHRELGIEAGIEFLTHCEELWILGDEITPGMRREIEWASSMGTTIKCKQWKEVGVTWKTTPESPPSAMASDPSGFGLGVSQYDEAETTTDRLL